ncbi:hypothetical protein FRC00_008096 [Tulasnella sp. 408]|nr:hypothetical protein FRC00_008096 [Tulasnella sp. 408]
MTRYDADRSDEPSTDEDDSNRAMERSKMRAIDDGSRRPSLPINVHHGPDVPSHNWAQASTAAAISPTNFKFGGDAAAPARLSIPASPTTPTAATFSAMMLAAANSMGSAQLQPLGVPSGASGAMGRSVSSPSQGPPLSPFSTSSFHTAPSPSESNESPHSGRDIKTRPRSRSNRAMKPLPSFMANAGIDSTWVPPWSSTSSSDAMAVAKTNSSTSNDTVVPSQIPSPPPGILPPGTNPFLMSSSVQARNNPFARRDRSATVTQQSVSGSISPPPQRVASGSLRSQSSQTALLAQARQGFPDFERPQYDAASSSGHGHLNHALMPLDPPPVSLDLMSVAAATGRMTSVHNQAFDTLSPEDGQVVLEQLKQRSSFRIRISRAFGGVGGSKDSGAPNGPNHGDDSSRDGRSASPHVVAVGKPHKDHHHHHHTGRDDPHHGHAAGPHEAAFEPPWLLMTPMYVKEAVIAAERSMYTGFASLGLAVQPNKKNKRQAPPPSPIITPAMRRNSVLDSVPNEAMCMVLPLWDLTLDLEEDKRRRRQIVDDLDLDLDDLEEEDEDEQEEDAVDEMLVDEAADAEALERKRLAKELAQRRKLMPPPRVERKYLLAYYVPFDAKRQSMAATTAPPPPPVPPLPNDHRTSKKRPRQGTNAAASRPSLQRRNSGSSATKPLPVKSFRVIARILTPAELRDSGLNPPRNIVDPKRMQQQSTSYFHSSLNYHRMDRRLSSSSIFGDVVPSAFNAVIAVCNDRRRGVEFVPEGLDSLGLCGGETLVGPNGAVEKLLPLFPPAHMVPVKERLTPPLNAVGRQIVEMIWGGCLALTELGI